MVQRFTSVRRLWGGTTIERSFRKSAPACSVKQVGFSPVRLAGPEAACSTMGRTLNGPRPALGGGSVAGGVVVVVVVAVGGGAVVVVVVASAPSSRCSRGRWLAVALSREA